MNIKKVAAFFSFFLSVAALFHLSQNIVSGQTCPSNGIPAIQSAGWQKGTHVSVYIDPAITGDARSATVQAFNNWNAASSANNSGVVYEFTTTIPTSGVGNYLIVSPGSNIIDPTTNSQVRAQTTYNSDPTTGYTTRGVFARILLVPQIQRRYACPL